MEIFCLSGLSLQKWKFNKICIFFVEDWRNSFQAEFPHYTGLIKRNAGTECTQNHHFSLLLFYHRVYSVSVWGICLCACKQMPVWITTCMWSNSFFKLDFTIWAWGSCNQSAYIERPLVCNYPSIWLFSNSRLASRQIFPKYFHIKYHRKTFHNFFV